MKPLVPTLAFLALAAPLRAAFSIDVEYDTSITAAEQSALDYAVGFWESRITGYTYDHGIDGLTLYVSEVASSSAINAYVWQTNGVQGSLYVAESAVLEIGSTAAPAMAADGTLDNALVRALGVSLGFGMYGTPDSLWNVDGLTSSATAYTGTAALAAYGSGSSLGIATISGLGAKGWNQSGLGNDLLAASPTDLKTATLSATSLAAFQDLGYTVAVPEVSSLWPVAAAAALVALRRRRRA